MRELEAAATKDTEGRSLRRGTAHVKEVQLMEEKRSRKNNKKKKEAASKKASDQINKVPEQILSQPQPVNGNSGISTVTSIQNNANQPTAVSPQQLVSRYPAREVPPRFRHQEQKSLVKRGQHIPCIAASLGLATKVLNQESPSEEHTSDGNQTGMPPIRDLVSHSPNQLDINHGSLGSHYESSHWGSVSSNGDSGTNWDKVIVDGTDKEAWPSITESGPDLEPECMDIDSTTNSGPEKSHIVPFGDAVGEMDTRNGIGHSSQSKLLVGSNSNNAGNGSINGPWGVTHGPMISTCQDGADSKSDSRHNRMNAWGAVNSSMNGVVNPSTLSMNGNHGAWPVLDSNGHTTHKGSNNSGTNVPSSTIGQVSNNRSINPKVGSSNPGSWGCNIQENGDCDLNGTRKASYSGQPQNLNTEMTGPNNTTNFMTSSLPNSAGLLQTNELSQSTGHGAWSAGTMNHSPLHTPSVTNGTSIPHLSNGEETNGTPYGTTWGASGSNYSGDKSSVPKGQANGDTVNATIMQPGMNGPNGPNYKINGNNGGLWESGTVNSQNMHWGSENVETNSVNHSGWGNPAQNTGTNIANGDWNKPNNQHSNEGENSENGRKGSITWKSVEEENKGKNNPTGSRGTEIKIVWAKSSGTGESEGSVDSTGCESEQVDRPVDRRKVDQQMLLQSIVNRGDLDPRVLCNTGWGQTPIRQNTAWKIEAASPQGDRKTDNGTEAWGTSVSKTSNSGGWVEKPNPNSNDTSSVSRWGDPKPATGWGDAKGSASQGNWGDQFAATTGTVKSNQSWGNGKEDKSTWNDAQKVKQGCGGQTDGWGENSKNNHWGATKSTKSSSSGDSDKSGSGWGDTRSNSWASVSTNNSSGWIESSKANGSQGWADMVKGGGDASKCGPTQMENNRLQSNDSSEWGKKAEGSGSWGGQPANNKPSGWLGGGPMPTLAKEEEPTGWGEPSPESIRRKMEIDDGTAAWGDPRQYKHKNVNMWDKNTSNAGTTVAQNPTPTHHPPARAVPNNESSSSSGWGGTWPETTAPNVDNGTAAWGKPMETAGSWGDQNPDGASSNWSNIPIGHQVPGKPGPKSMQDGGWSGDEMAGAVGHVSGWDEDDVEIGMWNTNSSQENNWSSHSKKMPSKGNMKNGNKQDDSWMHPFVKQFNNMGFSRESTDETLQSNKMDISGGFSDKRMDLDKSGLLGDYNRVIGKGPGPRHLSKESSMDHNPYFDKDGIVAEETQNLQFIANQNMKLPSINSALPTQSLGSFPGLTMPNGGSVRQNGNPNMFGVGNAAQARGPQPPQPMNASQPNLRAQVPPNMMPPQVPPSLLKYPPNNTGLNPLFGPQQVAMLNQLSQLTQLSQLSQISQLQRLLAQQQKVQNQRGGMPPGGRVPQEQARPLGMQPQPSRQLDPNLLMKQAMPPSQERMLHQPPKSYLDNVLPHSSLELPKVPSPIGAFNGFSLGLNSNVNMEFGGIKEPQSRLRKWTTVDSMSPNNSLDQNSGKHGAISSGFRLDDSPFSSYDFMNSSNSPSSPPGSIGDGWPSAKSPNGSSSVNWPPEFRPGEPWKGYPNIDPETDPYVTPGSVINNLSISTVRGVDHLRDRNSGSSSSLNTTLPSNSAWSSIRASNYNVSHSSTAQSTSVRNSDPKPTWSPGSVSNTSLAHELWKVPLPSKGISAPSRPPPGLTGQKPPLSAWDNGSLRLGTGWGASESRYTPGSTWSDNSSGRITNWLVLKNLTPQIDGSTLRTLCMQHGPLITFHLNLPHGTALVRYSSKEEVVKAQKSLHMCVLGNTTILAEFASEEEISRFFAQGQSMTPSPSWQSLGSGHSRLGSLDSPHSISSRGDINHWNSPGASVSSSGDLHGTSLWGTPNYSSSLWGNASNESRGLSSPSDVSAFLPVDHLNGEPM
ncbi:trinucleotide repeat-containing gene 6A protein isoform X4 [Dendrobates tinctorius]|uniref:trinucleotide repeat-containing gene 6A protein isoform X4 n=1 Tax=Dendrobates tinctorius TaxID=92724 RepID=UPI003CC957D4